MCIGEEVQLEVQVQRCSFADLQMCRGGASAELQRCKGAKVQRYKGVEVQRCRGCSVQRCIGACESAGT